MIEILEGTKLDDKILAACQRLKRSGCLIALDDYRDFPEWRPLIALADFIKVDVLATPGRTTSRGPRILADDCPSCR